MSVRELLSGMKGDIKTIGPKVRVETIAALLHENKVGAFPVVDTVGRMVGMLSERDIIRVVATHGAAGLLLTAEDVMTRSVCTVSIRDSVKDVMQIMTARHIRHLPVMDGDRLVAMISIRDVISYRLRVAQMEVNVLRDYAIARH